MSKIDFKKNFITVAAGFIGSYLCLDLIKSFKNINIIGIGIKYDA